MKLTKKILSLTTAMAMSMGTAALFPMTANAQPIGWESFDKWHPDWMPVDFASAMDFYNTNGAVKYDKGNICIVQHVPDSCKMEYDIDVEYAFTQNIPEGENYFCTDLGCERHLFTYDFKLPEEPDPSDAKAYADYESLMREYEFAGLNEHDLGYHYEVLVIICSAASDMDVNIRLQDKKTKEYMSDGVKYSFTYDGLDVTETDIYSWLPDSVPEFDDYIKKNGNISYRDGMLLYFDRVNYSTGAGLDIAQTGTGKLKLTDYSGGPRYDYILEPTGGSSCIMNLYTGDTEGDVDITFSTGRKWDPDGEDHKELTASVHIDEDMNVTNRNRVIPDWIPQDFSSAAAFDNNYGASFHIDDTICFIRRIDAKCTNEYPVSFEGSAAEEIKKYEILNEIYIDPHYNRDAYNVMAYNIPNDSDITVNYRYGRYKENQRTLKSYTYKKDSTGHITQTDKYFWLPDCDEEFSRYYEKYGAFSIEDGYIMYCTDVPLKADVYISTQQNGTGAVIEDHEEIIKKYMEPTAATNNPVDDKYHLIKLFRPTKPGIVRIDIIKEPGYNKEDIYEDETAYFMISENMDISPVEQDAMKTTVSGDCNGDGVLGISDAVALQSWLHGKGELPEYGIADINGDGTVDVFDLIAVKKQLIKGIKDAPKPVMLMISENYAWTPQQNVTVIDQYGTAYQFRYSKDNGADWEDIERSTLRMNKDSWYEKVLDIMETEPKTSGYIPDKAMSDINSMAENAEKYSDVKMYSVGYMNDAGSNSIYIINTDSEGNPVFAELATTGDCMGWIDDKEVKDFIKTLDSYNIYGGMLINLLEYNKEMIW